MQEQSPYNIHTLPNFTLICTARYADDIHMLPVHCSRNQETADKHPSTIHPSVLQSDLPST